MQHFISTRFRVFLASFFVFALWLGNPDQSHAHAVVTESSLTTHPIRPHHETNVVLFFNSNIELSLSSVFLVSAGDIYHQAEITKGKKPGELHIALPALEPGSYAIKYKVFAADGHLTENAIRFQVAQ
jgi:methionine-rich copper-binding protein CopC